jgi:hypothetical protein
MVALANWRFYADFPPIGETFRPPFRSNPKGLLLLGLLFVPPIPDTILYGFPLSNCE